MYNCFEFIIFDRNISIGSVKYVLDLFFDNKSQVVYNGSYYKCTVIFKKSVNFDKLYTHMNDFFDWFFMGAVF